jgi:hypothetical protein
MRTPLAALLLGACLALACASPKNPTGGSMAGGKGTSTGEPNGPVGLCMFDRQHGGGLRRCLSFTFGKCNLYGDVCTEDEYRAQQQAAGNLAH